MPDPEQIKQAAEKLHHAASDDGMLTAWGALAAGAAALAWKISRIVWPFFRGEKVEEKTPAPDRRTRQERDDSGLIGVLTVLAQTMQERQCADLGLADHLKSTEQVLRDIHSSLEEIQALFVQTRALVEMVGEEARAHQSETRAAVEAITATVREHVLHAVPDHSG